MRPGSEAGARPAAEEDRSIRLDSSHLEARTFLLGNDDGFVLYEPVAQNVHDRTLLPMHGGYTVIDRMRRGQPVVVHGDGTSLWTMTHHRDFAKGFVGLLGNHHAIGEAFHITSDEVSTWDQIHRIFADAAGASSPTLVHIPSEVIAAYDSRWGDSLLGDKTHSMVFDNSKIKRFVPDFAATIPLSWGAKEVMAWYDADPARQVVDPRLDALMDTLIEAQKRALPSTGN